MINKLTKMLYSSVRDHLTSYQWRAFLSMAIGICLRDGKKTLKALSYLASSPALSRFFNGNGWPTKIIRKLWQREAIELIRDWYWERRGKNPTVYLLIDGTVLSKRGKKLPKLGWHYDTRIKGLRKGQKLVIASVKVGKLILPWDFRTYLNKRKCKETDFKKSTQQAMNMIRKFKLPMGCDVVVAVDGALCTKEMIKTTYMEGYHLVGRIRIDRKVKDGQYARNLPSGTVAKLKGMDIPVQVVQSYREAKHQVIISTDLDIGPTQVKRRMKKRWWAEKLNEELKALGLEDCSCLGEHSVERWAGLVMLIYVLLARIRWEQPTNMDKIDSWSSWQDVGERLAKGLVTEGRWWEGSWLKRGLTHLKSQVPLFEPLRALLDGKFRSPQLIRV